MTCRPHQSLDRLTVRGLRGIGHHGVFEHERRDGQEFVVDVELGLDTRAAAAADDLSATVALRRARRAAAHVADHPNRST